MTTKHQIVLISGQQGAGKTTLANELGREMGKLKGWYVNQAFFASHIYEMHNFCLGRMKALGFKYDQVKHGPLLQFLGTEFGRKTFGDNVWVESMKNDIARTLDMRRNMGPRMTTIISDCRFENEFDGFPEALRIRLTCPEEVRKTRAEMWRENTAHVSETGLDNYTLQGKFDMAFDTSSEWNTPKHISTLIIAQLDKDSWVDKRHN